VSAIKPKGFSTIATAFAGQEDSDPTKASVGVKAKRSRNASEVASPKQVTPK